MNRSLMAGAVVLGVLSASSVFANADIQFDGTSNLAIQVGKSNKLTLDGQLVLINRGNTASAAADAQVDVELSDSGLDVPLVSVPVTAIAPGQSISISVSDFAKDQNKELKQGLKKLTKLGKGSHTHQGRMKSRNPLSLDGQLVVHITGYPAVYSISLPGELSGSDGSTTVTVTTGTATFPGIPLGTYSVAAHFCPSPGNCFDAPPGPNVTITDPQAFVDAQVHLVTDALQLGTCNADIITTPFNGSFFKLSITVHCNGATATAEITFTKVN